MLLIWGDTQNYPNDANQHHLMTQHLYTTASKAGAGQSNSGRNKPLKLSLKSGEVSKIDYGLVYSNSLGCLLKLLSSEYSTKSKKQTEKAE